MRGYERPPSNNARQQSGKDASARSPKNSSKKHGRVECRKMLVIRPDQSKCPMEKSGDGDAKYCYRVRPTRIWRDAPSSIAEFRPRSGMSLAFLQSGIHCDTNV